ncbi:MAG: A/G-specific adenine glycosylase [Acidobacteriaceae bacterium]|nr:A/G-specific adenine glycosylase [Acidobacteriaceae bacterium]
MPRTPKISEDAAAESASLLPFDPVAFHRALARWYRLHARELPWRGMRNPYGTWLSEIMLQQTRVATVIERYSEFMTRFPTIDALAAADESEVLALWSGLGYYRRARMLHRGARFVSRELSGQLPASSAELRTLPGIGEYTSAAIASIAFRESIAVVDGNVERVLFRVLGMAEDRSAAAKAQITRVAQSLMPPAPSARAQGNPPGDHNQAMMELGAMICLPRGPLCLQCPVVKFCKTRGEHETPPREKLKSRTVAHLLALRKRGTTTEVLFQRRSIDASLMPGMLELPPLPLEAVASKEPVLRLRHAITNTNYYVQVFAESAPGVPPYVSSEIADEEYAPFVAAEEEIEATYDSELRRQVVSAERDLRWIATAALYTQPMTGLARKILQRMGVMALPKTRIR